MQIFGLGADNAEGGVEGGGKVRAGRGSGEDAFVAGGAFIAVEDEGPDSPLKLTTRSREAIVQIKRWSFAWHVQVRGTSSLNFTKIESSRKMAYLSIDSKSMAMKNGQSDSGSIRFPHLMLRTSGIFRSCIRAFIIIASTRAGVTSELSL